MKYPEVTTDNAKHPDVELIDELLHDQYFRKIAEDDIGPISRVCVHWEKNEMIFYGTRAAKKLAIDETLALLKRQVH